MPVLTIIAGPNGSGKSSTVAPLDIAGRENLLDPDAIARRLNPEAPAEAAIEAGRELLTRAAAYIHSAENFAIETTLSGHQTFRTMREAKAQGFVVRLLYVALEDPELNIRRVRDRAAKGGHFVPDTDVRRRYARSLANVPEAIRIADQAILFDNTSRPRKVLEAKNGLVTWRADDLPAWTIPILNTLAAQRATH